MRITIDLPQEKIDALKAQAAARGLSLEKLLEESIESQPAEDTLQAPIMTKQEAYERILEIQKNVKPDPDGWTIKDYINAGRRF